MKRIFVVVSATAVAALAAAPSASAHPMHRGCDPGASVFAHAPGPFGQEVRLVANAGLVAETVATLHLTLCQEPPGPP